MKRVTTGPIAAFMIKLYAAPQFSSPEPLENDTMDFKGFAFDRDVPIAFTIVPTADKPALSIVPNSF